MSWAEIKKAVNSNLDVPLNEQIERINKYKTSLTPICVDSTNSLTVNNSRGFLYSVLAFMDMNTGKVVEVEIDGQTIFRYTTSATGMQVAIIPPADFSLFNMSQLYGGTAYNLGALSASLGYLFILKDKIANISNGVNFYYLYEPLYFESSLKVTTNGTLKRLNYALIEP